MPEPPPKDWGPGRVQRLIPALHDRDDPRRHWALISASLKPMPNYQPASRRTIAEMFRRTALGATRLCLKIGISADAVSYTSMVAAALAAACFLKSVEHPWLLILAPLLCLLRLWCNMLDGMVALAAGNASRRGEILNELPDRISDVLIFIGAAHSGLMHPLFGYWAALASLGAAYVGTLGQAVGARREYGGIMSKPWRMVVLGLGTWLTYALQRWNNGDTAISGFSILDWTCLIITAGCLQTGALRLGRILRALKPTND